MITFMALVAFGLAFMVYALFNFARADRTFRRNHGSRNARKRNSMLCALLLFLLIPNQRAYAQVRASPSKNQAMSERKPDSPNWTHPEETQAAPHEWRYGGFVDLGYLLDFNRPANRLFRNRGTTPRVDELDLNMAAVYVSKAASANSRWGMDLLLQAGQDSKEFGFSATAPNLPGANWLRQIGAANVSYLAPVGKGLTLQAGIFNSLIGYESLYAKDNFTYTRSWGADYSPYLMMGVNASYPFTKKLTGTLYVINGYFHLAHANNSPSFGGQIAYQLTDSLDLKETLFYGPQQSNTAPEYWRFFSDSIAEWKSQPVTLALEYQAGTENLASMENPRVFWTAAQLPVHWVVRGPWSATIRPEIFWDPDGRMTGFQQFVKSITTTLEYRIPYRWTDTIARLEYRFDDSTGPGGGFFRDGYIQPSVVQLTPTQHLLIFGLIWTLDSP